MQNTPLNNLPNALIEQQHVYYSRFLESGAEVAQSLTIEQLNLVKHAFAMSDFIAEQLIAKPHWLDAIFAEDFADCTQLITPNDYINKRIENCQTEQQLHTELRRLRNQFLIAIAMADLCQQCPVEISLANLSTLADVLIESALQWLTMSCQALWGQPQNAQGEEQPLLVYAMGKLGGKELNFSSDIDLIFTFPENGKTAGARRSIENQQFFTRLGQKLITALNQVTVDGFVFRVDMRLRPFGESGPLVLSFSAMETYYQDQGRDWERYAMLKARLVGHSDYHQTLTDLLKPFVYRRYIDFSVIESFRRMKLMIAQEARRRRLQQNIKLGVGGIREIEFIVQVFQLIRGGREVALQKRNLLKALKLLVKFECISEGSALVLENAYLFLRQSENAIQAFNDQQTQQLPTNELNQIRLSHLMGSQTWHQYEQLCQQHMANVNHEFNLLIGEDSPQNNSVEQYWVTLWHANWEIEERQQWINKYQPNWPAEQVEKKLRHFRQDIKKRNVGHRGRLILDKLIPVFLELLTEETQPQITLDRVLQVLKMIVTRTAYLELLYENPMAFKQLLKLCRASSWISDYLAKFPMLLDELIDPKLLYAIPQLSDYKMLLAEALMRIPEDDLEMQMEALRQFKQSIQLKIAAADITDILPVMKVSDHLTALAQVMIQEVVNMAWQHMTKRYGQPISTLNTQDKGFAVLGYGKLGGIELGYGSDLDLVFVHNRQQKDITSGEKSISASQFYLKMAQRILHLFNTRTSNGTLYEADMRLRPSGNSGLMVVHIDTFEQYQLNDAWTWEHQAIVRARLTYGDEALSKRFVGIRNQVLTLPRCTTALKQDVLKMREKMRNHLDKSTSELVDLKQGKGGLADIEFLGQYLVLAYAQQYPELATYSDNVRIFEALAEQQIIDAQEQRYLIDAYCALRDKGHECILQNLPTLIPIRELEQPRQRVTKLWDHYLVSEIK